MKLAIKYKDKLLLEKNKNKISFIDIPNYFNNSPDFADISIFVTLLCSGIINQEYSSPIKRNFYDWSKKFEIYFSPEYLTQIDADTYIYNLDDALLDSDTLTEEIIAKNFKKMPESLIFQDLNDLKKDIKTPTLEDEDTPFSYIAQESFDNNILRAFDMIKQKRTPKDVLLLYSAGKDSTLSAIRLKNMGYNPYFIHFNNGSMLDVDKPFLTFQKSFEGLDGYHFPYEFSDVDISRLFLQYFEDWHDFKTNPLLTSEIRCLSCRLAMYTKTLEIARYNKFQFVAEGARISQKFFIEQEKFIPRLKELASYFDITLLYPVLHLEDDKKLIKELLANNHSSKTWESKCLLGESALNKTKEDEDVIMNYYDQHIRPKVLNYLRIKE